MVGNRHQRVAFLSYDGEIVIERSFFLGMFRDIFLEVFASQSGRIESSSRRRRRSTDKRFHLIYQVVTAAVDFQEAAKFYIFWLCASLKGDVQPQALWIALPPVNALYIVGGVD